METFQGLFESHEKIGKHINALVELSSANGLLDNNQKSYIQNLALAYGVDPKTINFNVSENETSQLLSAFTEHKSKMSLLQDLISVLYLDGKLTESERNLVSSIGENLNVLPQKVNALLELNAEYLDVTKRLGDLIMLEGAN